MENLKLLAERLKALDEKILTLQKERERVLIAFDVVKELGSASPEDNGIPALKLKEAKPTPLKVPVMKLFEDNPTESFTVQQVWERISESQSVGKATINAVLSKLFKTGKLTKQGLGSYCLPKLW